MTQDAHSNANSSEAVQAGRLCLVLGSALAAVVLLTPILVGVLGASPRKASVSALRFAFLIAAALTWNRAGPGLAAESGLKTTGRPLHIWFSGFLMGAIPLTIYVIILTLIGERAFEGIEHHGKFWWAVVKYMPLALVIGFLEDMLFFGFLAALLGRRFAPCVVIYSISHFLAPSKHYDWQSSSWLTGFEALGAMGESLAGAVERPVEVFGLILVGATLAVLCRREKNIWLAMGVHGGWYYVRTISRKLGEDLQGHHEWLFGTDRFYDGVLGWLAIVTTVVIFKLRSGRRENEESDGQERDDKQNEPQSPV